MRQISARELRQWLDDPTRAAPQLLDVREHWEFDVCRIEGSRLVPMRTVPLRVDDLDESADIVVICHHGVRSYQVALFLERQGFGAVYNLTGGVAAWARDVDPAMPAY